MLVRFGRMGALAVVLAAVWSSGAAGTLADEKPFSFAQFGWSGTINEKDELHAVDRSRGNGIEIQSNYTQPLSLTVMETGDAEVVGAFQGDEVRTEPYFCLGHGSTLTTTRTTSGTIDKKERVSVGTDHRNHYVVFFEVPFITTQVTETQTQSPGCPGYPKTRTFDSTSIYFPHERTVPVTLPDPGVPKLEGTWRDPKPQHQGETNNVKVKLHGCGEEAVGTDWESRFPADNRLSALKEPFQQHVRDFIGALRKAGATVRIISVYRPAPRVYLMHYAFRVGYGNTKYPKLKPEAVPKYSGPEKVPICWTARDHDGAYSEKLSIQLAKEMVSFYGINQQHGPAYPSNHSQRTALDMAVSWNREKLVVPLGPEAGPNAKQAAVIATFPRTEQNTNLWHVGRSYGVFKYTSAADPQHWSANGH